MHRRQHLHRPAGASCTRPPIDAGILEGITRNAVIELARGAGHPGASSGPLDRHDVYTADECFLTGTAAEVIPVVECDGRADRHRQARADHAATSASGSTPWSARTLRRDVRGPARDRDPQDPGADRLQPPRRDGRAVRLRPGRAARRRAAPAPRPLRRSSRPAPTRCSCPSCRPSTTRETEEQSREALATLLDPSWGHAAGRRGRGPLGEPGRGDRRLRRRAASRPDRDRHPRPDRPEPRPARLGRRADRPRGPLPGPDDPRPSEPAMRREGAIDRGRIRRSESPRDLPGPEDRPGPADGRPGRRLDGRARGGPPPRRRRPGADGRRRPRLPGPERAIRRGRDPARGPRRHDRPGRVPRRRRPSAS